MAKIVLDDVASGFNLQKINANFEAIQNEFNEKVLYRDNPVSEPNSMESSLDMNGFDLLNVATLSVSNLDISGVNFDEQIALALAAADEAEQSALDANDSLAAVQAIEASIPATIDAATAVVLAQAEAFADAADASAQDAADAQAAAEAAAASIDPDNLMHLTGNETAAGIKTFTSSPIVPDLTVGDTSTKAANAKFVTASGVKAGTIIDFAGTTAPTGYLACPFAATNISRTTYADLFAAIGTTWGVGDGSTTFGMPWFISGGSALHSNGAIGTQSVGDNLAHTHTYGPTNAVDFSFNGGGSVFWVGTVSGGNTGASGSSANFAAGSRVLKCVKF